MEGIEEDVTYNVSLSPPSPSSMRPQQKDSACTNSNPTPDIVRSGSQSSESDSSLLSRTSSGYGSQDSQEGMYIIILLVTIILKLFITVTVAATGSTRLNLDGEPDFQLLYEFLVHLACRWEVIAINLGLEDEIDKIDADGQGVENKLRKALSKWKSTRSRPYTWHTVIEMLKQPTVQEIETARRIEDRLTN